MCLVCVYPSWEQPDAPENLKNEGGGGEVKGVKELKNQTRNKSQKV